MRENVATLRRGDRFWHRFYWRVAVRTGWRWAFIASLVKETR